jgi:C4-dicarboxylate-specific signal transduction histidine kinase
MRLLMRHHATWSGDVELISLWRDITLEHDLAERLGHTAKLAHMGELMSGLAHELNQPLTSITLAAENAARMADRSPLDAPRLKAKLDIVVAMAERASNLVERVRDFVRLDKDPRVQLRLSALIAAALAMLGNRLRLLGLTVVQHVPADLPDVLGRTIPLEQALMQLIINAGNACKALVPPCEKPELIIAARVLGDEVEVTIQDRAGGVPPEILPRIFEPFFTTKPVGQATGLGLSSAFGIIEEMGGSITADNHDGGARFTLLLPVA